MGRNFVFIALNIRITKGNLSTKGGKKMRWKEIEKKYGKKLTERIRKSRMLDGITISLKKGEEDIPERDIKLAIKEIKGEKISDSEWD